jgi:hypothetical protein
LVPGADLRVAEAAISGRPGDADLPRNHLPKPLRSGSRRAQEGARRASENAASHPAVQEGPHSRSGARPDRRCRLHPRAPCRGRGPCDSWPLGGGSPRGFPQHAHRDAGRAPFSVHDAGEGPGHLPETHFVSPIPPLLTSLGLPRPRRAGSGPPRPRRPRPPRR